MGVEVSVPWARLLLGMERLSPERSAADQSVVFSEQATRGDRESRRALLSIELDFERRDCRAMSQRS